MRKDSRAISRLSVEDAPIFAKEYLQAGYSPLASVLAHVPELLEATLPFAASVLGPSHLGERLKTLVILRTSVVNGCRYCTRLYELSAPVAGLSEAEIRALTASDYRASSWTERERAALSFVASFCRSPSTSVAPLKSLFRDDEIVALAVICGSTLFLNRFATAMELD